MTDAETMKHARRAFHWTQKEAAEALGMSVQQISAIEQGRSRLTRSLRILLGAYRDKTDNGIWRLPILPYEAEAD